MRILIIGGTGTVGSEVARQLVAKGEQVSVLTRRADAKVVEGASAVQGDLLDTASVAAAMKGHDGVFMATALTPTETHEGLGAVEAAKAAGVRRLVYMSVHQSRQAPHIPHFGSKIPIEHAVAHSGLEHTILQPNNFFQNDYWYKDAMLQYGVYPQPLGNAARTSRVDVRDIGLAGVNALLEEGHNGKTVPLVGPDALTAGDIVSLWSRYLNKPLQYGGDDLEAWAAQTRAYMPEWLVLDLKIMYGHFQKAGLEATPEDFALQATLLHREPRRFEDFVKETAAAWTAA